MKKQWFSIALGIVTATGGFLDVGTIATSGDAGAKFGLGLIWVIVVATAALILLVEMVGRFTAVSKKTYAAAIRENFGFRFYLFPLASEIIAESLLLAAEFGGMAIGLSLLTGLPWHTLFPVAILLVFLMAWRVSFDWIENGPALFGLLALSFVAVVFVLGGPHRQMLTTLWRPEIKSEGVGSYLYLATTILGATISPYLLYFYSSGAREEGWSGSSLLLNKMTAITGMGFGSLCSIALVILSAMIFQPQHMQVNTISDIRQVLVKPFGPVGGLLFGGIVFITCLGAALEVVLAISYNVAQGFGWEWGENKKPVEAARFNLLILIFLGIAVVINLFGIDPLQLAFFSTTVIALFLPISILPFLVLMNDPQYLRDKINRPWMNIAIIAILLVTFIIAITSIPLEIMAGGS